MIFAMWSRYISVPNCGRFPTVASRAISANTTSAEFQGGSYLEASYLPYAGIGTLDQLDRSS